MTSQLIFQPFRRFTYVTAHSPILLSLLLRHKLFTYVTWWDAHDTEYHKGMKWIKATMNTRSHLGSLCKPLLTVDIVNFHFYILYFLFFFFFDNKKYKILIVSKQFLNFIVLVSSTILDSWRNNTPPEPWSNCILYFIHAFSFKFATRWNCYRSLLFCICSFKKFNIISTLQLQQCILKENIFFPVKITFI